MFVNKVYYNASHAHVFTHCRSHFLATPAELSSRDRPAYDARNVYKVGQFLPEALTTLLFLETLGSVLLSIFPPEILSLLAFGLASFHLSG